jgi:hypothetical protein
MRTLTIVAFISLTFAAALVAGCTGNTVSSDAANTLPKIPFGASSAGAPSVTRLLHLPALIALDLTTGKLEYWHVQAGSSGSPQAISPSLGISQGDGLVGNGHVVDVANYSPPEVVVYNVLTGAQKILPDPYGAPLDIAVGTKGSLYVLHIASVTVFSAPGFKTAKLSCQYVDSSVAIATDNENDIFIDGYGPNGFMGVVEYPAGSGTCAKLHLRPAKGYLAGVGVDPKTDDLIVVDDPDFCAGGLEGRMLVYTKPYGPKTATFHNLKSNYCAGNIRLDAKSANIFVSDATISDGAPIVDQLTYPSSHPVASYSGGYFGGFTTIPNTLPN